MSLERRERLIEIAHERELLIVEDNPYGADPLRGGPAADASGSSTTAGWVIYLSTFSKILAPGIRVGWVAAPAAVLRKMNLGKQAADLCTSTVSQRFIIEYLRRYDWRDYVARLNGIYRLRRDALLRALEEEMPPDATWTRPDGGLFVWATLPSYIDTTDLVAAASNATRWPSSRAAGPTSTGAGATRCASTSRASRRPRSARASAASAWRSPR